MAATASPRSEPLHRGAAAADDRRAALARFLAAAGSADAQSRSPASRRCAAGRSKRIGRSTRVSRGGPLAGDQRLVLRTAAPTGVAASLGRLEEFAVLRAAFAAGVTVPEPLFASDDPAVFGKPFFIMRRVDGIAAAHRITRDRALDPALPAIAERLGRELAPHPFDPPAAPRSRFSAGLRSGRADAADRRVSRLSRSPSGAAAGARMGHPMARDPYPAAGATRCSATMIFAPAITCWTAPTLTGILDWEFAGWGDPHEDIGWFCCKGWRFARLDREAGGIADRAPFYHGYESASGRSVDPERVFFWEVLASVRWAIIALQQSDRYMIGGERNLDLALTGRRATECELEILMLLDPGGAPAGCVICRPGRRCWPSPATCC